MAKTKSKAKVRNTPEHTPVHHDKHAQDEQSGPIKAAFKDHTWPASRKTLLAHARQHPLFSKEDIARLERIPDRRYKSAVDVANAYKEVDSERPQPQNRPSYDEVGEVTTPQGNRMSQGSVRISEELEQPRRKAPQQM